MLRKDIKCYLSYQFSQTCWVSKWLLFNANSAIVSVISWREQVNVQWDDNGVRFVLDQHAELDFYSVSSLKQQSAGRHVALLGHIILIPSQLVFALSLLILRSNKYQFQSFWFDPTGARTHDLPHSSLAR